MRTKKEKDLDEYFCNFNKQMYIVNNPVDEYHRMKTKYRFDEQRKDEIKESLVRRAE